MHARLQRATLASRRFPSFSAGKSRFRLQPALLLLMDPLNRRVLAPPAATLTAVRHPGLLRPRPTLPLARRTACSTHSRVANTTHISLAEVSKTPQRVVLGLTTTITTWTLSMRG